MQSRIRVPNSAVIKWIQTTSASIASREFPAGSRSYGCRSMTGEPAAELSWPDLAALPQHDFVIAMSAWRAGRAIVGLAGGAPGGCAQPWGEFSSPGRLSWRLFSRPVTFSSLDIAAALHPQTLLATGMNGHRCRWSTERLCACHADQARLTAQQMGSPPSR